MKNKLKWAAVIIVIVLFAGAYSVVDKTTDIYNSDVDNSEYQAFSLQSGSSVSQTFITDEEKLDGMEFKMTASGEIDNMIVHYELQDEQSNVLTQKDAALADLKDGHFYNVKFDTLNECKGKEYRFVIRLDSCGEGESITLYVTQGSEKAGELISNGGRMEGSLVLRTISHRFDIETFVVTVVFLIYVVAFLGWLGKLFK